MKTQNTIYLGCDHAGFELKEELKKYLKRVRREFIDLCEITKEHDDYPLVAKKLAKLVVKNKAKGILVCGSGTGMVIAANRVKGARAIAPYDSYTARMSRQDNDTNIVAFRGRGFPHQKIKQLLKIWLATPFSNLSRHKRRITELDK